MPRPQAEASIGGREMTATLTIVVASHTFLNYPRVVSAAGYEASWMVPILSAVIALVVVLALDWLFQRYFSDMGLAEVFQQRFGIPVTMVLCVVIALYFLAITAIILRQFMENVVTTVLPNTPIYVVGGLFIITVVYVAFCGLEGIGRIAFLALPVFVVGIISLCLFTMNQWRPAFLFPLWGRVSPICCGECWTTVPFSPTSLCSP
ncbi:hypothetical protein GCM10025857_15770 [Alicyclobacillus contaminans]|nr:hypothetical protein GCM10025857_15770 [Alicyclobacillus contaminans]